MVNTTQKHFENQFQEMAENKSPKLPQPSNILDELNLHNLNHSTYLDQKQQMPVPFKINSDQMNDPHDITPFVTEQNNDSSMLNIRMSRTANSFQRRSGSRIERARGATCNGLRPSLIVKKDKMKINDNPYYNAILDNKSKVNEIYSNKFVKAGTATTTTNHP